MMPRKAPWRWALSCAAAALIASLAQAERTCTALTKPEVIRKSGCYRLARDLVVPAGRPGLAIYAVDVDIDLDGHSIVAADPLTDAAGVHAIGARRVTVREGTVRGFLYGVKIEPDGKRAVNLAQVRDMVIAGSTLRGIFVKAATARVERNIVADVPGYSRWPDSYTIGIELAVTSCRVAQNRVTDVYPEGVGEAVAISLSSIPRGCDVRDNIVHNNRAPEYGRAIGMWVGTTPRLASPAALQVTGNRVTGYDYAIFAPRELRRGVARNRFAVHCLPDDTRGDNVFVRQNTFRQLETCGDTPDALAKLAEGGDAAWTVRLAAAYIEQQWTGDFPWTDWNAPDAQTVQRRCPDYARARKLLEPLVERGVAAAADQMKRLESAAHACSAP